VRENDYTITTYEASVPAGVTALPHVEYMLTPPAQHRVWWLAADVAISTAVGGLRLSKRGGRTGRDVIGKSVIVEELSVAPSHQRTSVGTALLLAAEAWLASRTDLAQTLSLGVEIDNMIAKHLYTKLGYAVAARDSDPIVSPGSNGRPCHVMYKRLSTRTP
jgi:GNAT superfamily N-acetyltransferase